MGASAAEPHDRIGVLVIDDEMLVREGVRTVIESNERFKVVAESADVDRAIAAACRLRPRLAIISSHGGRLDTIDAIKRLRAACPETTLVLLTHLDDGDSVLAGMRAGAIAVVRTGIERIELLSVLGRALAGESVVDPAVATALVTRMASESDLAPRALPDPLTPRETEILHLVAQGATNREIAGRLILAVGTIKVHVEHILAKLGVHDRTQAAVRAMELGLIGGVEPRGDVATGPDHRAA